MLLHFCPFFDTRPNDLEHRCTRNSLVVTGQNLLVARPGFEGLRKPHLYLPCLGNTIQQSLAISQMRVLQALALPSLDQKALGIDSLYLAQLVEGRSSSVTARSHARRASDAAIAINASTKPRKSFLGRSGGRLRITMLRNDSRTLRLSSCKWPSLQNL